MSAAFDTIDRQILLDIIERIVEEDELRIIRFLLRDTVINTRITLPIIVEIKRLKVEDFTTVES